MEKVRWQEVKCFFTRHPMHLMRLVFFFVLFFNRLRDCNAVCTSPLFMYSAWNRAYVGLDMRIVAVE